MAPSRNGAPGTRRQRSVGTSRDLRCPSRGSAIDRTISQSIGPLAHPASSATSRAASKSMATWAGAAPSEAKARANGSQRRARIGGPPHLTVPRSPLTLRHGMGSLSATRQSMSRFTRWPAPARRFGALALASALLAAPAAADGDPYAGLRAYAGDIHVHTGLALYRVLDPNNPHSIGTVDEILDAAESRGLDFVVITEHSNNVNDPRGIAWREKTGEVFTLPDG